MAVSGTPQNSAPPKVVLQGTYCGTYYMGCSFTT